MKPLPGIRGAAPRGPAGTQRFTRGVATVTVAAAAVSVAAAAPAGADGYRVIATIPVAAPGWAPAVDPLTGKVYIPDGDTLAVADDLKNVVTGTIPLGAGNGGPVVVDPGTATAFVANTGQRSVSVVSLAAGKVTATIALSAQPSDIAVDPFTHTVYTTGAAESDLYSRVSVIDEASDSVTATIPLEFGDRFLAGLAPDPATGALYVSGCAILCDTGDLWDVDMATRRVARIISTGPYPIGVAVDPAAHEVYAGSLDAYVSVADEATGEVASLIPVGQDPNQVAADPAARTAYAANSEDGTVSVIGTATHSVAATVPAGAWPAALAVDPATHDVYVPDAQGASVSVVGGARPQADCLPDAGVCGYPDAETTGVPGTVALREVPQQVSSGPGWHFDPRGFVQVTGAGADLSGLLIPYSVNIAAPRVTLRDDLITHGLITGAGLRGHAAAIPAPEAGPGTAVTLRHAQNVTIEHTTIDGLEPGTTALSAGIEDVYGDSAGLRILHDNIADTSDGIRVGTGLIDNNYIHSQITGASGGLAAGITVDGGDSPVIIEHNTVLVGTSKAYAIGLLPSKQPEANRHIDGNLLAGGNYVLGAGHTSGLPTRNISVTGNRFSRAFHPQGGYAGPVTHYSPADPQNAWYGNFWDDTLTAVRPTSR